MNIPLFKIYWDDNDISAVSGALKRGMEWADGPSIPEFEKKLANYIGSKYAITFNSGTSALHGIMIALGVGEGPARNASRSDAGRDEVIVPSFSFIATANAPLFVGAKPVFADIDEVTYGLDVEDVKKKITEKTKAIMPMHYGGAIANDILKLRDLCEEKGIHLVEDAAESFGAKLGDEKAGTFGIAGMFSFCQTKVFTTGEGGCIVTDSDEIAEKLELLRNHSRRNKFASLGYGWRIPDCLAALGGSQLKKVDKLIETRREKANYYRKELTGVGDILVPKFSSDMFHVYQEFHIRTNKRDELKQFLTEKGTDT